MVVVYTLYSISYRNFLKIQRQVTAFIILLALTGTKKINTPFIKKGNILEKSAIYILCELFL